MDAKQNGSGAAKTARERLLDAAEQAFADKGFDGTSVRDLTAAAGCNIAAVNYHFGSKEKLYVEVFRRRMIMMRDVRIASIEEVMSQKGAKLTLEELIRNFAAAFLEPLVDRSGGRRFMKLMVREMSDPRIPRRMFFDEVAAPTLGALGKGIETVCPGLEQKKIAMSIISVIGQLVHIFHLSEMFEPGTLVVTPQPTLAEMLDHVVDFSAAAIRAAAKRQGEQKNPSSDGP